MDAPQQPSRNTEPNIRKAAEAIAEVLEMKQEFIRCHDLLANRTYRLVELLGQAESRGYLLEDSLTLVDTVHWLQMIDWQTKFLSMVLNFTKDPSRKTLRPLIELYGRDRDRMRAEVEILERQLEHRLAKFAQPDDATVRKSSSRTSGGSWPSTYTLGRAMAARLWHGSSRCPGRQRMGGWSGSRACPMACVPASWCSWTRRRRSWPPVRCPPLCPRLKGDHSRVGRLRASLRRMVPTQVRGAGRQVVESPS
jgi:hypothetical protein